MSDFGLVLALGYIAFFCFLLLILSSSCCLALVLLVSCFRCATSTICVPTHTLLTTHIVSPTHFSSTKRANIATIIVYFGVHADVKSVLKNVWTYSR